MINESKISVVMSVFNGEKYLGEAVDSILNQTFKDFEFIVINDGSTDGTREILESYNDSRIVLIHQENIGLTKSLNKGIALAKGEYIARQDADDISMPERLEKQIEFLENHKNIVLLGTAIKCIDINGVHLKTVKYPHDYTSIRKAINRFNCFYHGSVIFKRHCFLELGGYREFFIKSQDYDLWLRFVEKFEAANLSLPLYKYRFSRTSFAFNNLVSKKRMAKFARQLNNTRKSEVNKQSLIQDLKIFFKSPLSLAEKKDILQIYNHWAELLLVNNIKKEAFLLLDDSFENLPSYLYKFLFRIVKFTRSSFLLRMLIKLIKMFLILPTPSFYIYLV